MESLRLRSFVALTVAAAASFAAAAATSCAAAAMTEEPVRVAVFDFELIDTSLEGALMGPRADETRRLERLGTRLREAIERTEGFRVVDLASVAAEARSRHLQHCGGCDRDLALKLDADWSVTGTVQKVSNLILNINIYVRDVASGEMIQVMSADIRGNTDVSWERGLSWLIQYRLKLSQ